jgi:hypothetical protein
MRGADRGGAFVVSQTGGGRVNACNPFLHPGAKFRRGWRRAGESLYSWILTARWRRSSLDPSWFASIRASRRTLAALARNSRLRLWVISARRRADIRARVTCARGAVSGPVRLGARLPAASATRPSRLREGVAVADLAPVARGVDRRQGIHLCGALQGGTGPSSQHGRRARGGRDSAVAAPFADCAG